MPHHPPHRAVSADQALREWRAVCAAAGCPEQVGTERLALAEALGRVAAEPVWARRSSPAYDAAGMDGIAVRAADTVSADPAVPLLLTDIAPVDTGDPLPDGYDAVVMREHVRRVGDAAEITAPARPYQHVRSVGEDVTAGELLLPPGRRLRAVDLAMAAAAGLTELTVRRRPRVALLPTGDEVRPLGREPAPGEIPDTNSLMLAAQAREHGCGVLTLPIEPDDPDRIAAAIRAAAAQADLVIVIAGASGGRGDHTAAVIERVGTLAVRGVAVRPGHPVMLGVVEATPLIGAPGYPVSAALSFDLFAAPLLSALQGTAAPARPAVTAQLTRPVTSPSQVDEWVRLRLGRVGGRLVATPQPRGAGALTSLARADGMVVVPSGVDGRPAGSAVEVQLLRPLSEIDRTIVAIGSHDLVLDLVAAELAASTPPTPGGTAPGRAAPAAALVTSPVGSLEGLRALRDGLCHLAGVHLLDPDTGEYTLPYLPHVLGDRDVAVVRLVHREQGLIVAPGNPLGITGVKDLSRPGLRYVNRQPGSGTRVLLDHELSQHGIDSDGVPGYQREERSHLAVAAAVAAGRADAGLGVLAAARAFGLGFVPVAREPFDLVLTREVSESELLDPVWRLLADPSFHARVRRLGGYSCEQTGVRLR